MIALAVFSLGRPDLFWLTGLAAAAFVVAHIVYWLLIHPVNKALLKGTELERAGGGFFDLGTGIEGADWRGLRDRWEYSHIARAILMFGGFMLLAVAIAAG